MSDIKISGLFVYPIKSMAALPVTKLDFDRFGLTYDRRFMLIDTQNNMVTARTHPEMLQFQPVIMGDQMQICWQTDSIDFDVRRQSQQMQASIWSDQVACYEVNNTVSTWVSERLNHKVKLVGMAQNFHRQLDQRFTDSLDQVGFADGFPILLCNQASFDQLYDDGDIRRFRPNIVVQGAAAFAEDYWRQVKIAESRLQIVKPCSRCSMPSFNPDDASKQPDILRVLAKHRLFNQQLYFGQNVILQASNQSQSIALGQTLTITEVSNQTNMEELSDLLS